MPLLRRKRFTPEKPTSNLKADDEVFYCELTGEIFVEYEIFYQRMILCNSLVWSCECTGKPNLTFKEAKESEENVKKSLAAFPDPLKRAVLGLVHHTRRSKIQDLTDEIYDYLKNRYQVNEDVEVKVKDKWELATITNVPDKINLNLLRSPQKIHSPLKSPNKDRENDANQQNKTKPKSPLGHKNQWPDASGTEYKVRLQKKSTIAEFMAAKGKVIRRLKGVFLKDKIKLFIRQTCSRTTVSTDDGYWVVMPTAIETFTLGPSSIMDTGVKNNKKSSKREKNDGKLKKSEKNKNKKGKEKRTKSTSEQPKPMTLEEKRKQYLKEKEKEKEQKLLDIETSKIKKLREKEEEKARKRDEREKERELTNELKNLEIKFTKEFTKMKEDLRLEDSKSLPTLVPLKSTLDETLVGDSIMVVEFVNLFGGLFNLEEEIAGKITLEWIEEALTEHDAEGKYYQILRFLLHSYLKFEQDEKIHANDDDDDSTSGEDDDDNKNSSEQVNSGGNDQNVNTKKASTNAKAAAAWPMLSQGLALHEITIEPFALTEVLRLHILSSGVRFGAITNWSEWQHRGQFQLSDDPCVLFRHKETEVMRKILVGSIYDLDANEKLKILVLMCDQMLTLCTVRDYMEETQDKLKSLRKQLREIQFEENTRRKNIAKEKWKKKLAERTKQKEEIEKKKAQMEADKNDKNEKTSNKSSENKDAEEETPEQLEEKKKRKEAKENQVEEFYREKFLFKERQILNEIVKYNAVVNESPLGRDRIFRKYWKFSNVSGVLVENDDNGAELLMDLNRHDKEDADFESEEEPMDDAEDETPSSSQSSTSKVVSVPKVLLEDIIQARDSGKPLDELVLNRYKCEYKSNSSGIISRSPTLQHYLNNVQSGIDPGIYAVKDKTKWYNITSKEQFFAVLDSLNGRGLREQLLLSNLNNEKSKIVDYYMECEKEEEKHLNKKPRNVNPSKKVESNQIDKSLFKCMEDYVEGSLRDQLLDLEERIWVASFGNSKIEDRDQWRSEIEEGMMKLISSNKDTNESVKNYTIKGEMTNKKEEISFIHVNGDTEMLNGSPTNGDAPTSSEPMEIDSNEASIAKALPLHLKESVKEERDQSRCSTPVNHEPDSERIVFVKELSQALLRLERALEKKYIKPPLGETEETKKERLKEMIESGSRVNGDTDSKEDEEKKPSTCLSRWEESLMNCTSLSQVFVHLNTLDRSIMWDKSILNVKCRLCRRKGNEDEMLLCDGCDRGFHMSCLTPPLKYVPVGDWFCKDCKPVDVRRRRKHSKAVEDTEEEEETEEEEDTEEEDSDDESEVESESEEDEEYEVESCSEHEERCTVCDGDGTLILCDDCPRSYHVECCYPPLKKVPRGSWLCQICRGTDTDLPYRKRAATIEKKREKSENGDAYGTKKSKKTQQRGLPSAPAKRGQKSPGQGRPAKKARVSNDESSARSNVSVGRQQLKLCTTLINEIMKRAEAEVFLSPVDPNEVPDYLEFVDNPMDFGSIKRKLNSGKYPDAKDFLADVQLVFTNCETYNPPKSQVAREGNKLKTFIKKKIKELKL